MEEKGGVKEKKENAKNGKREMEKDKDGIDIREQEKEESLFKEEVLLKAPTTPTIMMDSRVLKGVF